MESLRKKLTVSTKQDLEVRLLNDFLTFSECSYIDRKGTESTLYELRYKEGRGGKAVHIGDGYFLTVAHVVKEGSFRKLVPQGTKSIPKPINYTPFQVLAYDKDSDLALLHEPVDKAEGKAKLHLANTIPSVGDPVSAFIRLNHLPILFEHPECEYGGVDFYNPSERIEKLGKLILPAGSLLFEKQGKVLRYGNEYLDRVTGVEKEVKYSPENGCLTSVATFKGESGSPMFLRIDDDKYIFAGVLTGSYEVEHEIQTPTHPLGYTSMKQTLGFFIHRKSIERLILQYLKKSPHLPSQ